MDAATILPRDVVTDRDDPRHEGVVLAIYRDAIPSARIRWSTGFLSSFPLHCLTFVRRPPLMAKALMETPDV